MSEIVSLEGPAVTVDNRDGKFNLRRSGAQPEGR